MDAVPSYEPAATLRVDPELARMAIGLQLASVFRLWVIARDLTRQANGSGQITLSVLKQALAGFNVRYGRSHFNTLLKNGDGLFWNRDRERLYLHGYQRLSAQLTDLALRQNPDLVAENRPGGFEVYLCPTGSAEQWHAMCYAGWLASRYDPTISRETLSRLFSRSADTLRKWERDHLQPYLQIRHNYAQCADTAHWPYPNLPAHTGSYAAQTPEGVQLRLIWQLPNSYRTKRLRLHRHRGQGRKARRMSNHRLYLMIKAQRKHSPRLPGWIWRAGWPRRRVYFASARRLKQYRKAHADALDHVMYLWRGENRHGHALWEPSPDGYAETRSCERLPFQKERQAYQDGATYRAIL